MTERAPQVVEPERLLHEPGIGAVLERANREYRGGLDEPAAFQRLAERLEARQQPRSLQRALFGLALGLGAAAAAWGLFVDTPEHVVLGPEASKTPGIAAEPPPAALEPPAPLREESPRELAPEPEDEVVPPETLPPLRLPSNPEPPSVDLEKPTEQPDARRPQRDSERRAPAQTRAPARELPPGATPARAQRATDGARIDCLDMARRGDPRAAEVCFSQRASGIGLTAEMALYEMARLRRDVMRDAGGALAALDDYRQRFPLGSLRSEVDLSRIELLSQLGHSREALRESETLLKSSSGQERAGELRLLRGNVFLRDVGDAEAAAREYGQAEAFGGAIGAEATRLRGLSLEALRDVKGAIQAYERYLAGREQPRRAEVTRRLQALKAGASARRAP